MCKFMCSHLSIFLFQVKINNWLYNRFRNMRSGAQLKKNKLGEGENEGDIISEISVTRNNEDEGENKMNCIDEINPSNSLCETIYITESGEACSYIDENEIISEEEYSLSFEQ